MARESDALRQRVCELEDEKSSCADTEKELLRGTRTLKESSGKVKKALSGTVNALTGILKRRDPYTADHQMCVANFRKSDMLLR